VFSFPPDEFFIQCCRSLGTKIMKMAIHVGLWEV
jgi:hypothetical protein